MSGDNTELVRRWFEATARRDLAAMLEIASPEIEYVPIMAVLEGRVFKGGEPYPLEGRTLVVLRQRAKESA